MTSAPVVSLRGPARALAEVRATFPRAAVMRSAVATLMLLPVIAIASYGANWTGGYSIGDLPLFGPSGSALLTGRWADVFADPLIQGGPFEVAPFGIVWLADPHGLALWVLTYTLGIAAVVFFVLLMLAAAPRQTGACETAVPSAYVLATLGAVLLFTGTAVKAFELGHPAQVTIPAMWLLAARFARADRSCAAAVVIALSAGWEPWGLLGAPIIFIAARPDLIRTAAAGLATVLCVYGPFVATGSFHMFSFGWPVRDSTLVHRLAPGLTEFPWTLRLLQSVAIFAVGIVAARLLRRLQQAVWAVPMTILATRLFTDPLQYPYYWLAPAVLAVMALTICLRERETRGAVCALVLVLLSEPTAVRTFEGSILLLLVACLVVPCILLRGTRGRRPTSGLDPRAMARRSSDADRDLAGLRA